MCNIGVYVILTNGISYKNLNMMQNTFPAINKTINPVPTLFVDPENTIELARKGFSLRSLFGVNMKDLEMHGHR